MLDYNFGESIRAVASACIGLACILSAGFYVVRRAIKGRRHPLNFYVTDIWAIIVGLLPSLWIMGILAKEKNTAPAYWMFAAQLALGQCIGALWGLLDFKLTQNTRLPSRFGQALSVCAGAGVGGLVVAVLILIGLVGPCFLMLVVALLLIAAKKDNA